MALVRKTKVYISILVCLSVLLGATIGYTIAQSSNTFYITHGIYPSAYSYTIYKEDSTYYSKNSYGYETSGTNATTLIQSVFNNLVFGDTIYFEKGAYYLTGSLTGTLLTLDTPNIHIKGSGYADMPNPPIADSFSTDMTYGTLLVAPSGFEGTMLRIESPVAIPNGFGTIEDIGFYGNNDWVDIYTETKKPIGLQFTGQVFAEVHRVSFLGLWKGINIIGGVGEADSRQTFDNVNFQYCYNGFWASAGEYL